MGLCAGSSELVSEADFEGYTHTLAYIALSLNYAPPGNKPRPNTNLSCLKFPNFWKLQTNTKKLKNTKVP
jgi:hypothetical protein